MVGVGMVHVGWCVKNPNPNTNAVLMSFKVYKFVFKQYSQEYNINIESGFDEEKLYLLQLHQLALPSLITCDIILHLRISCTL